MRLTLTHATARRLALVWGVHAVATDDIADVDEMMSSACEFARRERFAAAGSEIVIVAGLPFSAAGTTNLLRFAVA